MKTKFVFFSFLFISISLFSQETGSLAGKISDLEFNDDPLPFANVILKNTSKGTTTDFDGLFELTNIDPGIYEVEISFVGYETQTITVQIEAGKITEISTGLSATANALSEVIVTTVARRDSEIALLIEQRNALTIKQQIGAEEFSRKGLGDAAAAIVKTTGVSQQEGSGSIFVRGLGDRYNITSYNGLPVPSNDPSTKNIALAIFKTDIVQSISIDKTFDPSNYGDYAGASINIIPKEATKNSFTLNVGSGINSSVFGLDVFYLHEGPNFSGLYKTRAPASPLNAYGFHNSLDRKEAFNGMTPANTNLSLQLERTLVLESGARFALYANGTFENGFTFQEGIRRASVNTSGLIFTDYDFEKYQFNTNATGMLNLGYRNANSDLRVKLSSLLVNSTEQNQQEYTGIINVFDYAPEGGAFLQRGEFKRTSLFTHQLLADWDMSDALTLNAAMGYNTLENDIPDRRQITLTPDDWDEPEGPQSFKQTLNASDNHRFYGNLNEDEWNGKIQLTHAFGNLDEDGTPKGYVRIGYNVRFKDIAFEATQFNFNIRRGANVAQPIIEDIHNVDSYFNQANFQRGLFDIVTFRGRAFVEDALVPQTYGGFLHIHAAYARIDYKWNEKLDVILGIRAEDIEQDLNWDTSISAGTQNDTYLEWLPSLSLKYALNDGQNLRFAFSKSYTLPQFKEKAPFQYEEVGQVYLGNPSLYASDNYNLDVKWEWFRENSNLLSLGGFYKIIQNPINGVSINSASNDKSYANTGDRANALGAEVEVRHAFWTKETETEDALLKEQFNVGINASYMHSNQDLDNDKVRRETANGPLPLSVDFSETEAKLTGASDFIFNIDATYLKQFQGKKELLATVALNSFSERIFALGTEGRGHLIENGISTLDVVFKYRFNKNLRLGVTVKNLLNPRVERYQEILTRDDAGRITNRKEIPLDSFQRGVTMGGSLSYSF